MSKIEKEVKLNILGIPLPGIIVTSEEEATLLRKAADLCRDYLVSLKGDSSNSLDERGQLCFAFLNTMVSNLKFQELQERMTEEFKHINDDLLLTTRA